MGKRLTQEEVDKIFKEGGSKCIGKYIDNKTPIEYLCSCGNPEIATITLSNFKQGHRCKKCGTEKTKVSLRYSQEEIEKIYLDNNAKLIDPYINNKIPLKFICSCGRESIMSPQNFIKYKHCNKCGIESGHNKTKNQIEHIKECFKERGCELLENEYINNKQLLKYRCICGEISYISFNNFYGKKQYCYNCKIKRNSGENHSNWNPDREEIKKNNIYSNKCKNLLNNCLKRLGKPKEGHTLNILGYSPKQLQEHIENHPNYKHIKDGKWHIDHAFPIVGFIRHGIEDLSLINSLDNLQPLSEEENLSKNDKYNEDEFLSYCEKHGVKVDRITK